jgi:hypothetical protein
MSAESSLTAVAVVRALLNEDVEGLAVLLPDSLPEPGRELVASRASLTVLSAKVAGSAISPLPPAQALERSVSGSGLAISHVLRAW